LILIKHKVYNIKIYCPEINWVIFMKLVLSASLLKLIGPDQKSKVGFFYLKGGEE